MKTLKESILDQGWDYDALDPKTKFEEELIKYFDTVEKDSREGKLLYVNPAAKLTDNIYDLAKRYLKKISRSTATQRNRCALRAVIASRASKNLAFQLSFDNNPDNEYIDINLACIYQTNSKSRLLAIHGQSVECFDIDQHTFKLLKFLIDNK